MPPPFKVLPFIFLINFLYFILDGPQKCADRCAAPADETGSYSRSPRAPQIDHQHFLIIIIIIIILHGSVLQDVCLLTSLYKNDKQTFQNKNKRFLLF